MALVIMSEQEPSIVRLLAESLAVQHFVAKSKLATDLMPLLEAISRDMKTE